MLFWCLFVDFEQIQVIPFVPLFCTLNAFLIKYLDGTHFFLTFFFLFKDMFKVKSIKH